MIVTVDKARPFPLWAGQFICLSGVSTIKVNRAALSPNPLPLRVDWIVPD